MSKEDFLNQLKKSKKIKIDLLNGVVVFLKYDKEIKAFRGYSDLDLKLEIGIWSVKTIYQIATEDWGCKLIMEENNEK